MVYFHLRRSLLFQNMYYAFIFMKTRGTVFSIISVALFPCPEHSIFTSVLCTLSPPLIHWLWFIAPVKSVSIWATWMPHPLLFCPEFLWPLWPSLWGSQYSYSLQVFSTTAVRNTLWSYVALLTDLPLIFLYFSLNLSSRTLDDLNHASILFILA